MIKGKKSKELRNHRVSVKNKAELRNKIEYIDNYVYHNIVEPIENTIVMILTFPFKRREKW